MAPGGHVTLYFSTPHPKGERTVQPWPDLAKRVDLDNRGLEPPEPMARILAALKSLPDDTYLLAHNDREPIFLYPKLHALGYEYHAEVQPDESCLIAIRKPPGTGDPR